MITRPIQVEILEESKDGLKVKLPFLEVPIEMNWAFFNKRLDVGYFKVSAESKKKKLGNQLLPLLKKSKR